MHALSRPGFSVCTERSEHTRTNRGDASKKWTHGKNE
jgi:hypothetical protein